MIPCAWDKLQNLWPPWVLGFVDNKRAALGACLVLFNSNELLNAL